ncbi:hypothetical protein [Maridesulfovibrio sp.]|uniref:hypothetical protein n=1 Tax=Maridesulfovibrio sp. TaxID=2795000 RepID=UPI002A18A3BB|nr:hypothetical protein [Maridesulfovibrio sp.]
MRKPILLLSIIFLCFLVGIFVYGVKIYTSQEFYETSNIAHTGFRSDAKENAIWITVDDIENGYFRVKASAWISNGFDFKSAYVDLNDRLAGMLLFEELDLKAIRRSEKNTYYESAYIDYHGHGLFDNYPFDEHFISSKAKIVLISENGEQTVLPDEFVYSVYLDETFKITELKEIPKKLGSGRTVVASDEVLLQIERQPWFKCYFLLACMLVLIPIITMASGDSKVSSIDTPAFIISVFAIRKMLAPEDGLIFDFDLYLAAIIWCFGAVKMMMVTGQLYRSDEDFLLLRDGVLRLKDKLIEVGRAIHRDEELM